MKTPIAIAFLLPMILLSAACSRDTTAPLASPVMPTDSAVVTKDTDWLQAALHCGDTDFLRLSYAEQKTRMERDPRWKCEIIETHAGTELNCKPTEPQNAFDSRLFAVSFNHPMGAHQMFLHVQNDAETLQQAAARIWARKFDETENKLSLSQDGSMALRVDEDNGNDNMSSISCVIDSGSDANPTLPVHWQSAPVAMPISKTFASDTESDEGVAILKGAPLLKSLGKCGADHWRSLDFSARRKALEAAGAKCTELKAEGMFKADCTFPVGMTSFGNLPVTQFTLRDTGDRHESFMAIRATAKTLAAAMKAETMTELSPYPGSVGMYQNLIDDRYQYIVFAAEDEKTSELVCRMSEEANNVAGPESADAANATNQHEDNQAKPPGSISGNVQYPSENIPAMHICAIHGNGSIYGCTHIEAGQDTYRIDNLDAMDYVLVAEFSEGDMRVGGHANAIRCIRAPCPQSTLIPVTIYQGENKTGIHINEFLTDRGGWPRTPMADRE